MTLDAVPVTSRQAGNSPGTLLAAHVHKEISGAFVGVDSTDGLSIKSLMSSTPAGELFTPEGMARLRVSGLAFIGDSLFVRLGAARDDTDDDGDDMPPADRELLNRGPMLLEISINCGFQLQRAI